MLEADGTPFANTFTGQFLIPLLVILTASMITAGVVFAVKTFRQFQAVIDVVLEVKAEVLPNGGGSMRDAVNRVEAEQTRVAKDLKRHLKVSSAKRDQLDTLYKDYEARQLQAA